MDERAELVDGMRQALKKLETRDFSSRSGYQRIINNAEDLLFAVFEVGAAQIALTLEEKMEFAPMIQDALSAIGFRVCRIVLDFPPGGLDSSKIERSGLQFIFDYFKDFPQQNTDDEASSITQDLEEFWEEQDVDEWDEFLDGITTEYMDPGIGLSTYETPDVPQHHWWFFDKKRIPADRF